MHAQASHHVVSAQLRTQSLARMLALAERAAAAAGVSRLADLTHLDSLGFPVFQTTRPWSRSLATTMGRGSTRRAAIVSALLEAVETSLAEQVSPAGVLRPLEAMGDRAVHIWNGAPRDALAVRLGRDIPRYWLDAVELGSGRNHPVPFDLVSQDLTFSSNPDTLRTTIGLASGGSRTEALASAIAELLEHDLEADWRRGAPNDRRRCELDQTSIADPLVSAAVERIRP